MMTMLKKLLLKTGLFEALTSRADGQPDIAVVVDGETVFGIHTERDVEVRGHVAGDIRTPSGRVVVMPGGVVTHGTIVAREVLWQGTMGGNAVHCSNILISAGAKSMPDMTEPKVHHESITIGKVGALDVSLLRQPYAPNDSHGEPDAQNIVQATISSMAGENGRASTDLGCPSAESVQHDCT